MHQRKYHEPLDTIANGSNMKSESKPEPEKSITIVLWRYPIRTVYYFICEVFYQIFSLIVGFWHSKKIVIAVLTLVSFLVTAFNVQGTHQQYLSGVRELALYCGYWIGLGVLSSVGLGTGLHTFLLYLGPHIAKVTIAAFECMSTDFPTPPYPDEIICPEQEGTSMTIWAIMSKVRLEAFMWGAGTAIGELPPYFMARASRLGGDIEEEEKEVLELMAQDRSQLGLFDRSKIAIHTLINKVGFLGILLCASIPNPLFDLAGITCGHFLVPFWTFFGATLLGKAIFKMHIQKLFVIFVFSEHHVQQVLGLLKYIPRYGKSLQQPFQDYLKKQKENFHHKAGERNAVGDGGIVAWCFEKFIILMVAYFVISIVNSMAQSYYKRNRKSSKKM